MKRTINLQNFTLYWEETKFRDPSTRVTDIGQDSRLKMDRIMKITPHDDETGSPCPEKQGYAFSP